MYFHFQSDDSFFNKKLKTMRCEAVKANGQQCKNHTTIGQNYCHVHRKSMLHLQIKDSTISQAGKGLFASGTGIIFRKGDRICMYNGQLIDKEELLRRYHDDTAPYGIQLHKKNGEDQYEDGALERGIGSLANHSRIKSKINARLSISHNNRAQLIATKNIRGGKEIFVNYGDDYRFDENVFTSTTNNKSKLLC